jgi:hypothetical protein
MRPRFLLLGLLGVTGMMLTGCGASLVGSASTTLVAPGAAAQNSTTTTTAPLTGEVSVAFPVVACTTAFGGPTSSSGWKPTILLAPIPTALVGQVEFYSDGVHTVAGPTGWSCSQATTSGSVTGLAVFPSGGTRPTLTGPPAVGTQGIFATYTQTGRAQGVALVCPFFTVPAWQAQEGKCTGAKPTGETSAVATPDVVSVADPPGVTGSLAGSGGFYAVTGVVIFPQVVPAVTNGSSINVAAESCAIGTVALCPTILSDFEVREFPAPTGSSSTSLVPTRPTPATTAPTTSTAPTAAPANTVPPATTAPVATAPTAAP